MEHHLAVQVYFIVLDGWLKMLISQLVTKCGISIITMQELHKCYTVKSTVIIQYILPIGGMPDINYW
jgi:hypothetical protein